MTDERTATGWYHVIGNTYGTWLRGDGRGWRSRHHREHVEGDYRHPPPEGTYDELEQRSRALMKRDPVLLTPEQRRLAGQAMVERLIGLNILLIVLAVGQRHYHLLAKFPDHDVRHWVGLAKKHSSFELSAQGLAGGLWAKRCGVEPIRDRRHQVNAFRYIQDHAKSGAWVWTFRDGTTWIGRES